MSELPNIVRASPRAKALALGLFVMAVAVGVPDMYLTRRYLERLTAVAQSDVPAAIAGFRTWVMPQLIAIALIGGLAGFWMIREGIRAHRTQRYPQPDTWVIRDTSVRRGSEARTAGIGLIIAGATMAATPLLLVVLLFVLLQRHS